MAVGRWRRRGTGWTCMWRLYSERGHGPEGTDDNVASESKSAGGEWDAEERHPLTDAEERMSDGLSDGCWTKSKQMDFLE
jgi:hypothetical protein